MKLSDSIAEFIRRLLDEENGRAEIRRNELAGKLGCAPSQINYVITSRFTPEQGYQVESQRGGGGYIRITRVDLSNGNSIMHVVNHIGEKISETSARLMISNLYYSNILDKKTAALLSCATSDQCLREIDVSVRDRIRATLFKQMLVAV